MSNMRISGMASGMDTDMMVQNMMKVERMKVSRFEQNKQVALWIVEALKHHEDEAVLNQIKQEVSALKIGRAHV